MGKKPQKVAGEARAAGSGKEEVPGEKKARCHVQDTTGSLVKKEGRIRLTCEAEVREREELS